MLWLWVPPARSIADNLSKAGWSWGCVSAVDYSGRTIFLAYAYRGDGKRLIDPKALIRAIQRAALQQRIKALRVRVRARSRLGRLLEE
jgi:hypothetical protein